MDLTQAKEGEVYKVYLDDDFAIVSPKGGSPAFKHTLRATVLLIDATHTVRTGIYILLAWSAADGICPTGSKPIDIKFNGIHYTMGCWVPNSLVVESCVTAIKPAIPVCVECGDTNPYANPTAGPYRCALCRGRQQAIAG